jgi:hypothetical protein
MLKLKLKSLLLRALPFLVLLLSVAAQTDGQADNDAFF